jgi:glucosamine-6-phosphate deaminase
MEVKIYSTGKELARAAARKGADYIKQAIYETGRAHIIVATGNSQMEMLEALTDSGVDWTQVTAFHLDEYIGIPDTHPASFRKYLKERFVDHVNLKAFHYINGEGDSSEECTRLSELIRKHPIDVAFIGIGENAHLAFNDPPADFDTDQPYIEVELDEVCRKQQLGEGWFPSLEEVPEKAISMSIRQIMKSKTIICTVPDLRKADAVRNSLQNGISPQYPASILKKHLQAYLFLDKESSSRIMRI